MRSAVRQAIAWMVRDGLTPPTVGNTEPSQTQRLRMSQLRWLVSTTLRRGSSPVRAMAGVVVLGPYPTRTLPAVRTL